MPSASQRQPPNTAPSAALVVAAGRPAAVVEFESGLVDYFVDSAALLGVPKSVAAIYGVVFASPEPVSFADIENRLHLSRGSVSQGLRLLREMGAVKEVSRSEDRSELFEPDLELRKLLERFLEHRLQQQLDTGRRRLAALKGGERVFVPAAQGVLRKRLKKLQTWQDRSRAVLPVIRTFLKLG